jgi:predicted nucleic acid-binding protein
VIALDTNILVHAHRKDASLHESARHVVKEISESISPWAICYHSLIEFYGIVTHTRNWQSQQTSTARSSMMPASQPVALAMESANSGRLIETLAAFPRSKSATPSRAKLMKN